MASKNRAALIAKAIKIARKHYKPAPVVKDRTLLENLLYACCLENSTYESADKAFAALKSEYFDWNEARVSTIRELSEVLKAASDPVETATRIKRILHSVFETFYCYDVDPLKKQNIGVAVKQLEKFNGASPFVVAYVTSHSLGGHAIPVNDGLLESLRIVGIITDGEAAKRTVPGLERAVPKTKGSEVGSLLHQIGVEHHRSPYGPQLKKVLLEIEPDCKDQLPKRGAKAESEGVAPPTPTIPPAPAAAAVKKGAPATEPAVKGGVKSDAKVAPPKAATSKPAPVKPIPAKPAAAAPPAAKPRSQPKAPAKPPTKKPKEVAAASASQKKAPPPKKITKKKPK